MQEMYNPIKLPNQRSAFVGREAELRQIADALTDPSQRVLTLVGAGGVGKTRLAYQAAADNAVHFPDGVYVVPLVGVDSVDYFVLMLAEHLKLTIQGGDPSTHLIDYLRDKTLLLVLDNVERGADLLAELLKQAPRLKLLVTSRERLALDGEHVFNVGGLPFPQEGGVDAMSYAAVRLFEQMAKHTQIGYQVKTNLDAVIRLCTLTEGMPLALEMAASWVRRLSSDQIATQIQHDMEFLASGWQDVPEHERSIRALFEYAWRSLTLSEHTALMNLSVFRGGFTLETASRIANVSSSTLYILEDKALIRSDATGRYDLHGLICQYAETRLIEAGQQEHIRAQHLHYFVAWAEQSERRLHSPERMRTIQIEYGNIRAAMAWAFGEGDAEVGLRLVNALWHYWLMRGYWREGLSWLTAGLAHTKGATSRRALGYSYAHILAALLHDERQADLLQQASQLAMQLDVPEMLAMSWVSETYVTQGYDQAVASFERAIGVLRGTSDRVLLATSLCLFGDRAREHGNLPHAEALHHESIDILEADDKEQ